jgi:hypothetical protein
MKRRQPDENMPGEVGHELPYLVGKTVHQATVEAAEQGIEIIRVLESVDGMTVTPMTLDWAPNRLNLIVEGGLVVRAKFG